jgi:hypothetical protein
MQVAIRWLARYVALLSVLALPGGGCSQERDNSTADITTTSSSTAPARSTSFVAEVRAMTFGAKDLAAASAGELLRLGRVVRDGLGIEGLGFRGVVERLVRSEAHPTTAEATAFVRSAVRNLCPEHAGAVPARRRQGGTTAVAAACRPRPPHRCLVCPLTRGFAFSSRL